MGLFQTDSRHYSTKYNQRGGTRCPSLIITTMESKEKFEVFENGYKEGYLMAAQQVVSTVIRLINNHPSWMLKPEREQAKAEIKLATKHLLAKRGVIPYSHDVITGKAEEVPLDFEMKC